LCDHGSIEIDNNAAERAVRGVALGRKNYLFAGSDTGGERAAVIYSLIGSTKLNDLGPEAYLLHVLNCIGDSHLDESQAQRLPYRSRLHAGFAWIFPRRIFSPGVAVRLQAARAGHLG
jgi:transposase